MLREGLRRAPEDNPVSKALRTLRDLLALVYVERLNTLNERASFRQYNPSDTGVNNTLRDYYGDVPLDGRELLDLAAQIPIRAQVQLFPLEEANQALKLVKAGKVNGAAVLVM